MAQAACRLSVAKRPLDDQLAACCDQSAVASAPHDWIGSSSAAALRDQIRTVRCWVRDPHMIIDGREGVTGHGTERPANLLTTARPTGKHPTQEPERHRGARAAATLKSESSRRSSAQERPSASAAVRQRVVPVAGKRTDSRGARSLADGPTVSKPRHAAP